MNRLKCEVARSTDAEAVAHTALVLAGILAGAPLVWRLGEVQGEDAGETPEVSRISSAAGVATRPSGNRAIRERRP